MNLNTENKKEENIKETLEANLKETTSNQQSVENQIPFISMKRENITLFKDSIQKVGDDYVFLFDIDETLYKGSELFHKKETQAFHDAYNLLRDKFLPQNKDIPTAESVLIEGAVFTTYFKKYFNVSPKQLENIKVPVDFKEFISRDDKLRECLLNLPHRKWAFTNGLKRRAMAILEILGVMDCFEGVIGFDDEAVEIIGKPLDNAYKFTEELLGIENKEKVYFFDDNPFNIETGLRFGWQSIHVKKGDNVIDLLDAITKK